MKKAMSLVSLGAFVLIGAIIFLQWSSSKDISCEVREDLGSAPKIPATITKNLELHIKSNKPSFKKIQSEIVKDVKVQLSMNAASLNIFSVLGFQISIPAWQITQEYEDLSNGVITRSYSVTPKILGDFRSWNLATFTRKNGDWISLSCVPQKMSSQQTNDK